MSFIKDKDTIIINEIFPIYLKESIYRNKEIFIYDEKLFKSGWGNGYIALPKWHPYYKLNYNDIPIKIIDGLTYSDIDNETDFWIIGFDTNHIWNNKEHNIDYVKEQSYIMLKQCLELKTVQRIIKFNKIIKKQNGNNKTK